MSQPNNIQMPYSFMTDVYKLVTLLGDYECEIGDEEKRLCKSIESQIEAKISRMQKHNLYAQSKHAQTPEEREAARKQYAEIAGIHKDWKY